MYYIRFLDILGKKPVALALAGVGGLAVGAGIGFTVGKKVGVSRLLNEAYSSYGDDVETDEPQLPFDKEIMATPMSEVRELSEYEQARETAEPDHILQLDTEPDPEPVVVSVFSEAETSWDQEAEEASRSEDGPYILHYDEFFEDTEYKQSVLTYYEGDEMVANEADVPIYNWSALLGELKFGHGSNDANVVYIRNVKEKQEFEVVKHTGHFTKEVLGMEIEAEHESADLRHSADRRFRQDQ